MHGDQPPSAEAGTQQMPTLPQRPNRDSPRPEVGDELAPEPPQGTLVARGDGERAPHGTILRSVKPHQLPKSPLDHSTSADETREPAALPGLAQSYAVDTDGLDELPVEANPAYLERPASPAAGPSVQPRLVRSMSARPMPPARRGAYLPDPAPAEQVPAAEQPTIRISIGRIDVRAVTPPAPAQRTGPAAPRISLDEYLRSYNDNKP